MKSNRDVYVSFGVVLLLGVGAALADTDPDFCRDYVAKPGEQCMYPTEPTEVGSVTVCRCPKSRPCGDKP